jgi:hypothetical protein
MEACNQCPHPNDCLKVRACLDDINAPLIATGQFPRRITPAQASELMSALRVGRSLRRTCAGGKLGPAIVPRKKLKYHCALYPEWGEQAMRLAKANAKAADSLKGLIKSSRTHCGRGHEFGVHGLAYKSHVNGRRYRYCKLCNKINSQQGCELPDETVEKIKSLLRAGIAPRSFTSGGKPGYLARFSSVRLLRHTDPEVSNLVFLGAQRRKLACRQKSIAIPKRRIIKTTNLREPTLTGGHLAQPNLGKVDGGTAVK